MRPTRIWLFAALLALVPVCADAQEACAPAELSAITIHEVTDHFEIDVAYPVLCSAPATAFIRDFVATFMGEFKADPPEPGMHDSPIRYVCDVGYGTSVPPGGRLLSVVFNFYMYTGGAHGNNWPTTWVFDLAQGRALHQREIFRPGAYAAIRDMVREELIENLGEMYFEDMLESGLTPAPHHYARFLLTDKGIRFLFATYQVAPYVAGQQEATVGWAALAPWLTDSFRELLQ